MVSKNEAKYIQSLYQKKNRIAEQVFVAEGPKLVEELLQSSFTVQTVYATAEWLQAAGTVPQAREVSHAELERLSNLQTPNQVLAVVQQQPPQQPPVLAGRLTLVTDGIQDPGNLGTIIRIADWFGVQQLVASEDTVDLYNPKVVQSTMGSITRVKVWYQDIAALLRSSPVTVYGTLLNGKSVLRHEPLKEGLLVIGNESKGIREHLLPLIQQALTIPRTGEAESLNAAVATGIVLSHLI
ncbi:TrmH family RNA methyltransferase [Deminuibacter soli]|uniref:RNA methyltransferase n=1 Tax=Deminuibacter soli TaxID=2291815 RepID=A0A3E1NM40_9BACT|nr:RNA methyltransferase [Deminuibacter soli]RFM28971.1 RNA methyltransferase [Deminuibacter soli]